MTAEINDLRFCVFDNSNPKDPDYYFIPLHFLERFNSPALVLKIGNAIINMPLYWQILIGDPEVGDLEVMPLSRLNDRGFDAFSFNPITSYRPEFNKITVIDVYSDVKWYFPRLEPGQMLAVPLDDKEGALCVYFVSNSLAKRSELVNYAMAW